MLPGGGGAAHPAAHEDHRGDGGERGRTHAEGQQDGRPGLYL